MINKYTISLFILSTLCVVKWTNAQNSSIAINSSLYQMLEKQLVCSDASTHTSIKPLYANELNSVVDIDSLLSSLDYKGGSKFLSALQNRSLVEIKNKKNKLTINPAILATGGYDSYNEQRLLQSGLGFAFDGSIGEKFHASGEFLSCNASFPSYVDSVIRQKNIVPGRGIAHTTAEGFAYENFTFQARYIPSRFFSFEIGNGKHFLGNGYRSLLLSHNTSNYPYFKISAKIWKLKYISLFTRMSHSSLVYSINSPFEYKYNNIHYLSWDLSKRFNIGFFESIIWQENVNGEHRGFDLNYINPVIFLRPVEFSMGSPDNALLGLNFNYKLGEKQLLYAQIMLDDFIMGEIRSDMLHVLMPDDSSRSYGYWTNKIAYQLGWKAYDVLGVENLNLLAEYNLTRPYTYSHRYIVQNYSHANQSLTHPLGANFVESIAQLSYRKKKWFFSNRFIYALVGLDTVGGHFGQNIFQPTYDTHDGNNVPVAIYGNVVGQGIKTKLIFNECKLSYLINPKMNLRVEAKLIYRKEYSVAQTKEAFFGFLGITSSLNSFYNEN